MGSNPTTYHRSIIIIMGQSLSRKNFTNKQHKIFQEAFEFFDRDNDGQITKEEILTVMTNLGVTVSEEDLDKRMKEFDKDHDGIVEFSEFVYLMKDVLVDTKDDRRLTEAFGIFDQDGNGFIDIDELGHIMNKLGQSLNIEQVKDMIKCADLNLDGKISFEEFKSLMLDPY